MTFQQQLEAAAYSVTSSLQHGEPGGKVGQAQVAPDRAHRRPAGRPGGPTRVQLGGEPVPGPYFHPEITKIAQFLGQRRRLFEGAVPIMVGPAFTHVL